MFDRWHYKVLLKQLKVVISVVEDQYEIIDFQDKENRTSVLEYLMSLIGWFFFMLLTVIWILQIVLYIIIKKW